MFGSSAVSGSTPSFGFGTNSSNTNTNAAPSSGFGAAKPALGSGGGLFGGSNQTATSGFGANSGSGGIGGGLFGGNTNQQQQQQAPSTGGGLFGASNNTNNSNNNTTTGGGLFGSNNAAGSTSGGLFGGANNTQTGGLFGSKPATGTTGGLFGGGNTAQQNNTTGGGLFGGNTANKAPTLGGGLFGGANTQQQQQQQQQQKPSLFGGNTGTTGGGLFGGSSTNTGATGGLFSAQQNQQQQPQLQQQQQQQQQQLTAMTRVGDLPQNIKQELEEFDRYINKQHLVATTLQADYSKHNEMINTIPRDINYLHNKLLSTKQALKFDSNQLLHLKNLNNEITEDISKIMQLILQLSTPGTRLSSSFQLNEFFIKKIKKYYEILHQYEGVVTELDSILGGLERSCTEGFGNLLNIVEVIKSQYHLFMELCETMAQLHNEVNRLSK
ncbi:nucleoporin NUP49/NSP49 [Scheffersomyces xylosifermentans]|uniref:nucleoporin NUP49/NSP49 n=1 Tax=Scheffersomyces xylosifermentans TaxID=1304137 RepID=UPI00315C7619